MLKWLQLWFFRAEHSRSNSRQIVSPCYLLYTLYDFPPGYVRSNMLRLLVQGLSYILCMISRIRSSVRGLSYILCMISPQGTADLTLVRLSVRGLSYILCMISLQGMADLTRVRSSVLGLCSGSAACLRSSRPLGSSDSMNRGDSHWTTQCLDHKVIHICKRCSFFVRYGKIQHSSNK